MYNATEFKVITTKMDVIRHDSYFNRYFSIYHRLGLIACNLSFIILLRIANKVYEDLPITLPHNAILFNDGNVPYLKLRDASGFQYKNKTSITRHQEEYNSDTQETLTSPSSNYITVNLNRQR